MGKGLMTGKPFSRHTIEAYLYRVENFLSKYSEVSLESLSKALCSVSVEQFAVKDKLYKAVVCFAKFLDSEGESLGTFLEKAKTLAPKPHKEPKRHTVNAEKLSLLVSACNTPLEYAAIHLLARTGLRASEFCVLTLADIDLGKGILTVQRGKGGKRRRLGLDSVALNALYLFLVKFPPRSPSAPLFLNCHRQKMNAWNLYQLLQRVGKRVKVKVSPHTLRRAFVTINANKGRPLQMLQKACGHASIKTTMDYCQTQEQEVINAMKDW